MRNSPRSITKLIRTTDPDRYPRGERVSHDCGTKEKAPSIHHFSGSEAMGLWPRTTGTGVGWDPTIINVRTDERTNTLFVISRNI